MKKPLLFLLFVLFTFSVYAQHPLKGRVVDEKSGEPLGYVSVYINTTTQGTATNEKGEFSLSLPDGKYEIVVTYMGYEPIIFPVDAAQLPPAILFKLKQKENSLKEVVVQGKRDSEWYANLEVFKEQFLGKSAVARQCKLLNPEVLAIFYDPQTAVLEVKANEPLQIRNPVLGYKQEYLLTEFKCYLREGYVSFLGYPKYELLPGSKAKQRRWEKNRLKAYNGSSMHFVRALRHKQLEQEGFNLRKLYRYPNPNRPSEAELAAVRAKVRAAGTTDVLSNSESDILSRARLPKLIEKLDTARVPANQYLVFDNGKVRMAFKDFFQVVYTGELEEMSFVQQRSFLKPSKATYQTSVISMKSDTVDLEENGSFADPLAILFEGYWAWEKVGDMLPLDYKPVAK
jgi:hypothetical protein